MKSYASDAEWMQQMVAKALVNDDLPALGLGFMYDVRRIFTTWQYRVWVRKLNWNAIEPRKGCPAFPHWYFYKDNAALIGWVWDWWYSQAFPYEPLTIPSCESTPIASPRELWPNTDDEFE